jgi:hypothetical protein
VTSLGAGTFGLSATSGGATLVTVNFAASLLPAGAANGSFVQVKANAAPNGGAVSATLIQLEDIKLGIAAEKVRMEGIASADNVLDFSIDGQRVITDASTLFEGGLKADFAKGVRVEAEGPLDANGAIVAVKIVFRSNIKIEGDITAFTAGSSLTVLGKPVAINPFTRVDSGPLASGQHVEVRANLDRDGNLIASRVVVRGAVADPTQAFLQGPVSAKDATAGTMNILGVAITATGAQFRISTDQPVSQVTTAADFFTQVKTNVTVVKVRWRPFTATTAVVDQAEIQLGK